MGKKLFEILKGDANFNFEWLMIDSNYVKVRQHAAETKLYQRQRKPNSKIHLAVNKCGLPVKFIVIEGTWADCKTAIHLIKNIDEKLVFADRACDTNEILSYIAKRNMK